MNADEKDIAVELALYKSLYEENYLGCYDSLSACVKEILTDTNDIPEWLTEYIDWEKIGKDWEASSDLFAVKTADNKFHLFLQLVDEMNI